MPILSAAGISVRDQFIVPAMVKSLRECAVLRRARGQFAAARIGAEQSRQLKPSIRGDFTCWLAQPLFEAETRLLQELEVLRLQLNQECFLGLFETELHYAWYPQGAGYARHVDQPVGSTQRRVSLALYLNPDWEPGAGGALRLFEADGGYQDVEPLAGRLACFLTTGREHAVLATQRERYSISGWFRSRD